MKHYSIDSDKRLSILGFIISISIIIYFCLDYFVFGLLHIENPIWNTIWLIIKCILPISSMGIAYIIIKLFNKVIFKICGIKNVSGTYKGTLLSNYDNFANPIEAEIEIKQNLFSIRVKLKTKNSVSYNCDACLRFSCDDTFLLYHYENKGNMNGKTLNRHYGNAELQIVNNKIIGSYYNDPRERSTYGKIEMKKI